MLQGDTLASFPFIIARLCPTGPGHGRFTRRNKNSHQRDEGGRKDQWWQFGCHSWHTKVAPIDERCKAASRAYVRVLPVRKASLRLQTTLRVFMRMVEPWPLTVRREKTLISYLFPLIRRVVNSRWPYDELMSRSLSISDLAHILEKEELSIPPTRWGVLCIGEHDV